MTPHALRLTICAQIATRSSVPLLEASTVLW
jgi:hypothetical protein